MLDLVRDAVRYWRKMKATSPISYYLYGAFHFLVMVVVPSGVLASYYSTYCSNPLVLGMCVAVVWLSVLLFIEWACGWNWLRYIFDRPAVY